MLNLLVILFILTLPLVFAYITNRLFTSRQQSLIGYAIVGLACCFLFFSIGHVLKTQEMLQMLPSWLPGRSWIIYLTGLLELIIAIALIYPPWRRLALLSTMAVLVLFFPANIYAAFTYSGLGGHQSGPSYLWIRTPMQVFLFAWAYVCYRKGTMAKTASDQSTGIN